MKRQRRKGERGVALAMIGIAIFVFFAMMVIAIDFARYSHTAAEVQAVADLAALSGAKSLLLNTSAQSGGDTAALPNTFDGRNFLNDGTVASLQVDPGHFDPPCSRCPATICPTCSGDPQGQFTAGGTPINAARAWATGKAVHVITASLISNMVQRDVARMAVAAFAGADIVAPDLPILACPDFGGGWAHVDGTCRQGEVLKSGIRIQFQPLGDQTACWSSLNTGSSSASAFDSLLPTACGGLPPDQRPVISVAEGLTTGIQNGSDASVMHDIQNCAGLVSQFVLPIGPAGSCDCNTQALVTDFATVKITFVQDQGSTKYITVDQICNNFVAGGRLPGAGGRGTRQIALVR